MKITMHSFIATVLIYVVTGQIECKWNASDYQNNAESQYPIVQELIDKVTSTFKGNELILDIGCGPGTKTYPLAQKVPSGMVYGIDFSLDMIEKANDKYGSDNLKFFHADAETFKFKEPFDLITAFSCLHWIQNQQEVLNRISKSLKNEGSFLLTMALEQSKIQQILKILAKIGLEKKWQKYMPSQFLNINTRDSFLAKQIFPLSVERLKSMLENVSLKIAEHKIIENSLVFHKEKFIQWLKCWLIGFPLLAEIPNSKLEEFIGEFVNTYLLDNEIKNESLIPYSSYILLIHAKKMV